MEVFDLGQLISRRGFSIRFSSVKPKLVRVHDIPLQIGDVRHVRHEMCSGPTCMACCMVPVSGTVRSERYVVPVMIRRTAEFVYAFADDVVNNYSDYANKSFEINSEALVYSLDAETVQRDTTCTISDENLKTCADARDGISSEFILRMHARAVRSDHSDAEIGAHFITVLSNAAETESSFEALRNVQILLDRYILRVVSSANRYDNGSLTVILNDASTYAIRVVGSGKFEYVGEVDADPRRDKAIRHWLGGV